MACWFSYVTIPLIKHNVSDNSVIPLTEVLVIHVADNISYIGTYSI